MLDSSDPEQVDNASEHVVLHQYRRCYTSSAQAKENAVDYGNEPIDILIAQDTEYSNEAKSGKWTVPERDEHPHDAKNSHCVDKI